MSALRELLALFTIDVDDKKLHEAHKHVESFAKKLGEIAKEVAEVFAAEKLFEFVKTQVEVNAHLQVLSQRLDVSATDIRSFGLIAQSAGIDLDSAANALGYFEKTLGKAEGGSKKAKAAIGALGITTKDAEGKSRPMAELLGDVAEKLAGVEDHNKRAAMATELFGRTTGRALLPVLSQGREAFERAMEDAAALGDGLGDEFYEDVKKAAEGYEEFSHVLQSLKNRALDAVLPAVKWLGAALKETGVWLLELDKETHLLQAVFVTLGIVVGVMLVHAIVAATTALWALVAPFVVAFGVPIAIIGALVWIFQDLYKAIKGGHSVIGDLIEQLGGVEGKTEFLKRMNALWENGKKLVYDLAYALGYFVGVWEQFGIEIAKSKVGKLFGEEIWRELEGLGQKLNIAASAAQALLAALEAIPKAVQALSMKPIMEAIGKHLDARQILGDVLSPLEGSSIAEEHGVPGSAGLAEGPPKPNDKYLRNRARLDAQSAHHAHDIDPKKLPDSVKRLLVRLAVADPSNVHAGGPVVHEGDINVVVHANSKDAKGIAHETAGAIAEGKKNRRNALHGQVKP